MEQQHHTAKEPQPQVEYTTQAPSSSASTNTNTATPSASDTTAAVAPNANPSPNPSQPPRPLSSQTVPRAPSPAFGRPWQPSSTFSHFTSSSPTAVSSSAPSPSLPPGSVPQRGGVAIGVPASATPPRSAHPTPQSSAFPSSFRQPLGASGRVAVLDSPSSPTVSQGRPMQAMGMMATLGSSTSMRSGGVSLHQPRPVQSSLRSISSPTGPSPSSQVFQGHSITRPSGTVPGSLHTINQPWLSTGVQGKPPLPPSSRPPTSTPTIQHRSHIPQQHPSQPTAPRPPHILSAQQQPSSSHQPHEQSSVLRSTQSLSQPSMPRVQGLANQKPSSIAATQTGPALLGIQSKIAGVGSDDQCNRILSKRSIHDLVSQIDPSEKLDPEVEDILVDIAEDFIESITTFGCSLAKHRKSDSLEAKDILLHLERNWHMRPPGFNGDEIKTFRKPVTTDIHKERLAAIKRSVIANELAPGKHHVGQAAGTAKGGVTKAPANLLSTGHHNR